MSVPGAADSSARIRSQRPAALPVGCRAHIHPVCTQGSRARQNSGIFCPSASLPMETPEPGTASPSLPVLRELSLLHREWLGLRNLLLLFWLGNRYHLLISCLLQASGHCWSLSG